MECKKVKELLSLYVEGALEEEEERKVKEHLSTCPACREELLRWKSYFQTMNALEKVKAPEDFIYKLHTRLRKPRVWERLFSPLHIKLPLEVVGVAAMVFIVLHILQPLFMRDKHVAQLPPSIEEKIKVSEKEEGKYPQLVLLLPQPLPLATKEEVGLKGRETINKMSRAYAPSGAGIKKTEKFKEKVTLEKIEKLVTRLGGEVLLTVSSRGNDYIKLEIPVEKYNFFLEELKNLGELKKPLPPPSKKEGKITLWLNIHPSP